MVAARDADGDAARLATAPADFDVVDAAALHLDLTGLGGSEDGEVDVFDLDPAHAERHGRLESLIEAFVEAFNAHDLERSQELLAADAELPGVGGDPGGFAAVVTRCWEERPHAILTRGVLTDEGASWDGQPIAVLWDVSDEGGWLRTGLLTFEGSDDEQLGLVEYVDVAELLDEVDVDDPEPDVPEGASWREWDEGADPP